MELLVLKLVIALRSLGADGIIKLASDGLQRSKHGEVNEKILKHTIGCSLMLIPSYESYIIFNCYIRVMSQNGLPLERTRTVEVRIQDR